LPRSQVLVALSLRHVLGASASGLHVGFSPSHMLGVGA
jgi:hypothetical protein